MKKKSFWLIAFVLIAVISINVFARRKRPPRPRRMPLRIMDVNKDGVVTKKEWDDHHNKMFKEFDVNGDGKIDKVEIKQHREKMRGKRRQGNPEEMDEE